MVWFQSNGNNFEGERDFDLFLQVLVDYDASRRGSVRKIAFFCDMSSSIQFLHKPSNLGRFTTSINPFEHDEDATLPHD